MSLKETKSKYALLGLLTLGPMSGYDMRQTIERSLAHFWNESYGQIYPMLRQLAAEGLTSVQAQVQEGRPDRRVYMLTDAGWNALRAWLSQPVEELSPTRNELLLKLFFGQHGTPTTNAAHVQHYRELQLALVQHFSGIEAFLRAEHAATADQPYWLFTLSHGQHIARALIAWCDETLAALEVAEKECR